MSGGAATGRESVRGAGRSALLAVLASNMLLDAVEVSVMLPAVAGMADDLGLSPWQGQWVMSGFALGFAAVLLAGRQVTARWGRRVPYLVALAVFAAASVVPLLTHDPALIVLSRIVKGACAALTAPVGLAILADAYPDGPERRRAVTVYTLFGAAGFTVGLLVSGTLSSVGWQWAFVFGAPIAVAVLLVAARVVPADTPQPRTPAPAGWWRSGGLARAAFGAAVLNGTYLAMLLLTALTLHGRGWPPWLVALAFLPACLPVALTTPFGGTLIERVGTGRLVVAGASAAAAGQVFAALPIPGGYATQTLPALVLVGLAFVLSFGALNTAATASVPAEARGAAVPVYQCAVQCGAVAMLVATAALATLRGFDDARILVAVVGCAGALTLVLSLIRSSARTPA
ncbi:arabinose transporter permease [Saccharomonospora sp. CUA-673]|uniref:MFS transporter n=1 Tax=Saccharomonospora sp. CUA-673 TaxID=1904969 RepID=UPI000959CD85|nr:MFS transporter [Saccharomonospora sp. CUA-673]OLT48985.1 arabinose transporter permease [Saccharomonospora sp. CUA-673]